MSSQFGGSTSGAAVIGIAGVLRVSPTLQWINEELFANSVEPLGTEVTTLILITRLRRLVHTWARSLPRRGRADGGLLLKETTGDYDNEGSDNTDTENSRQEYDTIVTANVSSVEVNNKVWWPRSSISCFETAATITRRTRLTVNSSRDLSVCQSNGSPLSTDDEISKSILYAYQTIIKS